MNEALVVSNLALWLVIGVMAVVIAALVRQVGVLTERVAPAGALAIDEGARVGEAAPQLSVPALHGEPIALGGPRDDARATLLFFLSPDCPVCKTLLPAVRSLRRHEAHRLDVVLASDGSREEHERFATEHKLDTFPYVLSPQLGMAYGVSKLPFAALVDGTGVLRARGLVNTREHLESLLEAMDLGVATLQEHMARDAEGGPA